MCVQQSERERKKKQTQIMTVLAIDVVGLSSCICGAENWLLIELALFVKKVAKLRRWWGVVEGDRGES